MRILMTGATGFIGSNLLKAWSASHEIGIIVRPNSKVSDEVKNQAAKQFMYDGGFDSINKAFDSFRPEIVIHLASYYVYEHKSEELDTLIESNVKVGTYLLEAMKQNGVKYLINTGTSFEHFGEEDKAAVNLYAATKQAFGDLCKYYCDAGFIRAVTLKLFDSYGDGDERKKLLNLLKTNLQTQEELKLSPGEQVIDIVHVSDLISAYQVVLESMSTYKENYLEFGLSGEQRCTLKELVELIEQIAGKKTNIAWGARPYRDREVMRPWENFKPLPGWKPQVSLNEGIKRFLA
ncbi:NAD-dependent epimerase/dehydratase family protein [Ekhidna sp. To15]|uniref:NAD-dependent epimerase/dehydratase family protein n=1 Tax=Ekhidna sp. To15 TaxID=3395267 RepID=UPI003F51BA46